MKIVGFFMKNKAKLLFIFTIGTAMIAAIFVVTTFFFEKSAYLPKAFPLERLIITGTYKIGENGTEQLLTPDTRFVENPGLLYIYGSFDKPIPQGSTVMLRLRNIKLDVFLNGELVFSNGKKEVATAQLEGGGNLWASFVSPGITPHDSIVFKLQNPYLSNIKGLYDDLLGRIYSGNEYELFQELNKDNGIRQVLGIFTASLGVFILISSIVLFLGKTEEALGSCYLGLFTLFSGLWFSVRFDIFSFYSPNIITNAIFDTFNIILAVIFVLAYLITVIDGKTKPVFYLLEAINIAYILLYIPVMLFRVSDPARITIIYDVVIVLTIVTASGCLIFESVRRGQNNFNYMRLSLIILAVGVLADITNLNLFGYQQNNIYQACFIIFVIIHIAHMITVFKENTRKAERLENELTQNSISLMLSQIRPHFIFNVLNTISSLCLSDPMRASEATTEFATYLRSNIDSLYVLGTVPFENELTHVRAYLALEKKRFEESLTVVYDIRFLDFVLPVLSLQPIVENAVQHGLQRSEEGGRILISTRQDEKNITITVSDDGAGFNPNEIKNDGKSHIGIVNVKNRIENLIGGTFTIQSDIGKGTTITIEIPNGSNLSLR